MRRVDRQDDWPQSWKDSYAYDRQEIYGEISNHGYACAYENRRRQTPRLCHMKTETLLRILPRRRIDMFEAATRRLPFSLQQKLLVQMAIPFRKREPVSDEICSREQDSIC